jgi:hypothetical protein
LHTYKLALYVDKASAVERFGAIDLQKKNLEGGEKGGGTPSGRLVFATTRVSTGGIP